MDDAGKKSSTTTEAQLHALESPQQSTPWTSHDILNTMNDHRPMPLRRWQWKKQTGDAVIDEDDNQEAQEPQDGDTHPFRT
jgi:hypothetical protein